jgi:hypothetical protein
MTTTMTTNNDSNNNNNNNNYGDDVRFKGSPAKENNTPCQEVITEIFSRYFPDIFQIFS